MSRTGTKDAPATVPIAVTSRELATLGFEKGLWSESDIDWIFRTVARACTDNAQKWLYLKTCAAHGLSPLKNELYAIERWVRPKDKEPFKTVIFVTSYHVFVSRARRGGWVLQGEAVCENDVFEGWDANEKRPVKHIVKATNRGKVIAAYAMAFREGASSPATGNIWPVSEIFLDDKNPMIHKAPIHMATKTAIARIGRLVQPDLSSLYAMEEFGVTTIAPNEPIPEAARQVIGERIDAAEQIAAQRTDAEGQPVPQEAEVLPAEEPAEDDPNRPIAFRERSDMLKHVAALGMTHQADVLAFLSRVLGRPIENTKDLKLNEFQRVMKEKP